MFFGKFKIVRTSTLEALRYEVRQAQHAERDARQAAEQHAENLHRACTKLNAINQAIANMPTPMKRKIIHYTESATPQGATMPNTNHRPTRPVKSQRKKKG